MLSVQRRHMTPGEVQALGNRMSMRYRLRSHLEGQNTSHNARWSVER
jgi:hypothetical protein